MKRFNPSLVALALAAAALFASLGGPAWAVGLISGSQIKNGSITGSKLKNGAITSQKIGTGQVQAANLAVGAVNGSNVAHGSLTGTEIAPGSLTGADIAPGSLTGTDVAPGSLTASDVAPNTFLAANGTATNANALGGLPASSFVHGGDNLIQHRLDIPSVPLRRSCWTPAWARSTHPAWLAHAEVSFTAEAQPLTFVEWGFTSGGSPDLNPSNTMVIGDTYSEPNPSDSRRRSTSRSLRASATRQSRRHRLDNGPGGRRDRLRLHGAGDHDGRVDRGLLMREFVAEQFLPAAERTRPRAGRRRRRGRRATVPCGHPSGARSCDLHPRG